MTDTLKRYARRLAPSMLALGLCLNPAIVPSAHAQEPEATAEKSEGDPVPGYLGAGLLTMLILFIVGKSARR